MYTLAYEQRVETRRFGDSCLPLTMELGRLVRRALARRLARLPAAWPVDDRILALADPSFSAAIARFHDEDGPSLTDALDEDELAALDRRLLRRLLHVVATVSPRTARACLLAADQGAPGA